MIKQQEVHITHDVVVGGEPLSVVAGQLFRIVVDKETVASSVMLPWSLVTSVMFVTISVTWCMTHNKHHIIQRVHHITFDTLHLCIIAGCWPPHPSLSWPGPADMTNYNSLHFVLFQRQQ